MIKSAWIVASVLLALSATARADLDWDSALAGEHRSEQNKARDQYRHPKETLTFFGLEAGMTVMEVSPGGGWYTEVLGPLLKGNGKFIAAHSSPNGGNYARRSLGG
ncbi:MAG: methyltransferase, partial [Halieaceae bacterium]